MSYKHFHLDEVRGITILRLTDHNYFEQLLINELQDEMVEYASTEKPEKLVVDFGIVQYWSSGAINALIKLRDHILAEEHQLRLCDMPDTILAIFKITKLNKIFFEIHDTISSALDSFK